VGPANANNSEAHRYERMAQKTKVLIRSNKTRAATVFENQP